MRRTAFGLATMSLLIAACGGVDTGATSTTVGPSSTTTSVEPSTSTSGPTTTTAPVATTTSAPSPTTSTLAGEPIVFGPAEGDVLMVMGVRFDDVLNLRVGPGPDQQIREEIPPTYTELVAEGNARQLPTIWIEVDYEGTIGWVHLGYIAYEGATTDQTAAVVDQLGERPVEPTMTAMGELVATVFGSEDVFSDVVQVSEVTSGDLSEVIYDVVGNGDDSVHGVRLHIFAEEGSGGFTLRSVEATTLCARGVDDGVCV